MYALELAREEPPANEALATQKLITLLKRRLERDYPSPRRVLRDAHPKQHGLVRANFIVEPQLSDELRVGVFRDARTFPAWIRFSNMSGPPQADSKKDSRGIAVKLMEVEGQKILEREPNATTQDFVLMSTQFFVTKDVAEFARLVEAFDGGLLRLIVHFLMRPRLLTLFLRVRGRCANPLEVTYGSTTPYLLGTQAVKYMIRPSQADSSNVPTSQSANSLREAMVSHLSQKEANLDFLIQVQRDAKSMPIEDPRVVWSEKLSPFVKVATLNIPVQVFDTPEQHEYGDNLSFTPWHCLPVHRPLGGINRARKLIYDAMSEYRHSRNSAPVQEPSGWVMF